MTERCENCGGRYDRPGRFHCETGHPSPTTEPRIVEEIIADLTDRSGMGWDDIDADTQDDIRDAWVKIVAEELDR